MVVDDHGMFIDGLKSLLAKNNKVIVVDEASSGEDALEKLQHTDIDLLITDINMPGMSGTELTQQVKETYPDIKVLVVTMYNDTEIINEILISEAEGYILKNTGKQELYAAIDKVVAGGTYYSNEVLDIILSNIRFEDKKPEDTQKVQQLTSREMEILKLICEEYSTIEIAEKLFISPRTVETHRKHILQKTEVKTIVGLIKFAIYNKLV